MYFIFGGIPVRCVSPPDQALHPCQGDAGQPCPPAGLHQFGGCYKRGEPSALLCSRAVCMHALCVDAVLQVVTEVIPLLGLHDLQRALAVVLLAGWCDVFISSK